MTSYPTPVLNASRPTGDISKIYTTLTEIIYEANINGKLLNYGKLFLPEPKGPVSPEELISNGVMKNSLVWKNGMAQWLPAGEIHEIVHERNLRYFNTPAIPSHTTPFTGKQQYQTGQLASMGYPVDHFVLFAARNCLHHLRHESGQPLEPRSARGGDKSFEHG